MKPNFGRAASRMDWTSQQMNKWMNRLVGMVEIGGKVVFSEIQLRWKQEKHRKTRNIISPVAYHWDIPWYSWVRLPVVISSFFRPVSRLNGLYLSYPWRTAGKGDSHDSLTPNFIQCWPGSGDFSWRIPRPLRIDSRCSLAFGNSLGETPLPLVQCFRGIGIHWPEKPETPPFHAPFSSGAFPARKARVPNQYETPGVSPCQPVNRKGMFFGRKGLGNSSSGFPNGCWVPNFPTHTQAHGTRLYQTSSNYQTMISFGSESSLRTHPHNSWLASRLLAWPELWSCWQNSSRRAQHGRSESVQKSTKSSDFTSEKCGFDQKNCRGSTSNNGDKPSGMMEIEMIYLDAVDQDLTCMMVKWIGASISPDSSCPLESLPEHQMVPWHLQIHQKVLKLGNFCCHLCIFLWSMCNEVHIFASRGCFFVCVCSPPEDSSIFRFLGCLLFLVPETTSRRLKLDSFDLAQQQASKAMEIFRKAPLRNERVSEDLQGSSIPMFVDVS